MFFLSHNSGSRYARRSIKGSEDADDGLVSTTILNQKIFHWLGAQGQAKFVKIQKHALFVTSPRENPKHKSNYFFSKQTRRLSECSDGLNNSQAIAAADIWPKRCRPLQWPA